MTDGDRPLANADLPVHEERVDALWERIASTRRPTQPRLSPMLAKIGAAVAVAFLVVGPVWALRGGTSPEPLRLASGDPLPPVIRADAEAREVLLSDGSQLTLAPDSEVRILFNEADRIEMLQRRGQITYDVDRRGRLWRVDAGLAAVEVVGTRFVIQRDGEVHVRVERGRVVVRSVLLKDGVDLLGAGQALDLPAGVRVDDPDTPVTSHDAPETAGPPATTLADLQTPSRALLLRAEALRRAGSQREATILLHQIVERDDDQSPLAAFTLGRIHQRARPELAAHDFALAIRLGLEEPLRRAAHRRWVETLEASGGATREAEAALLRAYPDEPLLNEGEDRL
ncbi:MAG: FecR family protein [Myxococcota bacterium]